MRISFLWLIAALLISCASCAQSPTADVAGKIAQVEQNLGSHYMIPGGFDQQITQWSGSAAAGPGRRNIASKATHGSVAYIVAFDRDYWDRVKP